MKKKIICVVMVVMFLIFMGCDSRTDYENDYISFKHPEEFESTDGYADNMYVFRSEETGRFFVALKWKYGDASTAQEIADHYVDIFELPDSDKKRVESVVDLEVDGNPAALIKFRDNGDYSSMLIVDYLPEYYINITFHLPKDENGDKITTDIIESIKIKQTP